MKILIVSEDVPTPSIPGVAKHPLALIRALAERGHEVDFTGNAERQLCEEAFGETTLEGLMLGKSAFALARGDTPELRAYAAYPGQLCLYDSLQELVSGMLGDAGPRQAVTAPCIKRSVDAAIAELLEIYRAAPSAVLHGETFRV